VTEKTLPEIYRGAAALVLLIGKVDGEMKRASRDESGDIECYGYCTMGAVFDTAGLLDDFGNFKDEHGRFANAPEFIRMAKPIADQLVKSGRYPAGFEDHDERRKEDDVIFWTIANWNDSFGGNHGKPKPSAEDVARLLRETASAVEAA
jgi:hypothetical protein